MKNNTLITSTIGLFAAITFLSSCNPKPEQKSEPGQKTETAASTDPLPSWNEGPAKKTITDFVRDVTKEGSPNFIPVKDRIATFDNDGTLWSEQPTYYQVEYAFDVVTAMAAQHPEWKNQQPFKSAIAHDFAGLMQQGGMEGLMKIMEVSHSGMNTDEFDKSVKQWVDTARNDVKDKLYTELVFQPMLELLSYLEANDFKTFIVSGGGVEFMRVWGEEVYGIPVNQIIGSTIRVKYEYNDGHPTLIKLPELNFNNDDDGKPVGIYEFIGRKPVFAVGNSDGDIEMLQWAGSNEHKSIEMFIHHTDSVREWAYDRNSLIGTLDKGFDQARQNGWTVVDMQKEWKVIYPFEKSE